MGGGKSHSGWDTLKRIIVGLMRPTRIMSGCCCCNPLEEELAHTQKMGNKTERKVWGEEMIGGGSQMEGGGANRDVQEGGRKVRLLLYDKENNINTHTHTQKKKKKIKEDEKDIKTDSFLRDSSKR